jgi:hypothetical protein
VPAAGAAAAPPGLQGFELDKLRSKESNGIKKAIYSIKQGFE